MSLKKFGLIIGALVTLQTTALWAFNGWNATLGLMYLIGAAIICASLFARLTQDSD